MELWAITSYFNPAGFRRRKQNFLRFRDALDVPLLAVELSFTGAFELRKGDADVLVQERGESILWHKERLLNIAVDRLPSCVDGIAWIDADVLFLDPGWRAKAESALEKYVAIQLFRRLYELGPDDDPPHGASLPSCPAGVSMVSAMLDPDSPPPSLRPRSTREVRQVLHGLAWAGRRELLARHGFYDAMILGSGDRAMACAAFGRFEDFRVASCLSDARYAHYRRWAVPFHRAVAERIGFLDGDLAHLWHGDLADRRYLQRHSDLAKIGFDPNRDIELDERGCWRWATEKPELHRYVRDYFVGRNEDALPIALS